MNETQTHDQLEADIERASRRTLQSELAWQLRRLRDGSAAADAEVAALVQEWLKIPGWDQDAQLRLLAKCHQVPAKLKLAAIKAAQPVSNGVAEHINEIHSLAFNALQADALARLMAPGEYYLPGQSTPRGLRTNIRIYPRSEITHACRTTAQLNDSMFLRGFPGEPEIAAAEERLAEANKAAHRARFERDGQQ
jgi:hypothetical protein